MQGNNGARAISGNWTLDSLQPCPTLQIPTSLSGVCFSLYPPRTQQTCPRMVQDNKLPPPRGSPFMSRMRRLNMRPFVITGAFFIMLWSITCASASFLNVPFFKAKHGTNLAAIYNIMASIHLGVVVIEVFGIVAAARRSVGYVRIYTYLSILAALMITTAGSIQMGVHYNLKDTIIDLCRNVKVGEGISFPELFGLFSPGFVDDLGYTTFDSIDQSDVERLCKDHFDDDSLSNIIALPVASSCAALLVILVFAYFRQLRDLTSVDNFSPESVRRISVQRMNADEFVPPPPQYEGL